MLKKFGGFQNTHSKSFRSGTETEVFLIKKISFEGKQRYTISIDKEKFIKNIGDKGREIEILPEFDAFMLEIIPKDPYEKFLSF